VGQLCLPDKEFRYLRHSCYSAVAGCHDVARSFLPDSPCRHEDRTVPSPVKMTFLRGAQHAVSEDPARAVSC
jgi:hypothetical protein